MDKKFEDIVIIEKIKDTFLEYNSLDEFVGDVGEECIKDYIGYFPSKSNVTYDELKNITEDTNWTVAYHTPDQYSDMISYMKLIQFNSTLELKRKLDSIVEKAFRGKEYVTIYRTSSLIYL